MKIIYCFGILICLGMLMIITTACDNNNGIYSTTGYQIGDEIIYYDGCEYIQERTYNGYFVYIHKGNCRKCWKRMEDLIRNSSLEKLEKSEIVTNYVNITNKFIAIDIQNKM